METIRLFNEKAEELLSSTFVRTIKQAGGRISTTMSGLVGVEGTFKVERNYPDLDEVKAAVLTLRFFFQDKDRMSIRKVAEIYESINIDAADKEAFAKARNILNTFGDYPHLIPPPPGI